MAAGGQVSYLGAPAGGICRFRIDGVVRPLHRRSSRENPPPTTPPRFHQNGFALTMATSMLAPGDHQFGLSCNQVSGDVEFHDTTITAQLVG